jgi:hypothetical protein
MLTRSLWRLSGTFIGVSLLMLGLVTSRAWAQRKPTESTMSSMGRLAARARARIHTGSATPTPSVRDAVTVGARSAEGGDESDNPCLNEPDCGEHFPDGPSRTQSETSIAIDSSGQHVVLAFNDFRGFSASPISVSGFMYSDDGGKNFTDGGQLPVTTGTSVVGGTLLPEVFGDPDVKYLGGCTFIYSSILIVAIPSGGEAETMGPPIDRLRSFVAWALRSGSRHES